MADKLRELGIPCEVHTYPGKPHGEDTINEEAIIGFLRGKASP
jgi:acetyl esterase/lipase